MATARAREPDASLRRVQRDAAAVCVAAAMVSLVLQRGRLEGALGVLAGGALMAFSYRAIRSGVDAIVGQASPVSDQAVAPRAGPRAVAWAVTKFIGRYALIAVAAWALLVPLRAHPLGLFVGVTTPVLAIGIEAVRLRRASRDGRRAPARK